MLLQVPAVLDSKQLFQCREWLAAAEWVDGNVTAGSQSAQVKNNLQLPEQSPIAQSLQTVVLDSLLRHAMFYSAALPKKYSRPYLIVIPAAIIFLVTMLITRCVRMFLRAIACVLIYPPRYFCRSLMNTRVASWSLRIHLASSA